jgi:translocation protein SEC62
MSGQTRSKKGQKDQPADNTLTKEEQQIAQFLRLKCPSKQGNLAGMKVEFFIASKLIDSLMESKWGPGPAAAAGSVKPATPVKNAAKEALLGSRVACVAFMQRLLNKQLFYRAVKIYKDEEAAVAGTAAADSSDKTPNLRKRKKEKEIAAATTTTTETTTTTTTKSTPTAVTPDTPPSQKEAKRKFKLELHQDQKFIDANEPFVWVYETTSTKTYIIGGLLILGAIGICLFPLWPSQVREGVYYVSLAGASFLGAILAVAAFKYVLYGIVWAVTFGTVSFWLFPNLTEDVGIIESFIPAYKCTVSSSSIKKPAEVASSSAATEEETVGPVTTRSAAAAFLNEAESNASVPLMTASMTTSSIMTRKMSHTMTELSKSTIEISTSSLRDSPSNKPRKGSIRDEEDFELVDNEDVGK